MLPRASGRYFNHASVKRDSLPDQASSRSAWFFFLGQVNCQFKHLLSQIGWKRSGRRGRSLLWPRLQCDLSGYWSRREQETHGCDRISGPPTANPVIRMQWWLTQLRIPIAQSPLKPRTAFYHCPLVIQPQWLVWTCDDHSSVHINCLMNN